MPKNTISESDIFYYKWKMGPCYGPKDHYYIGLNVIFVEYCCLLPGQYVLTCENNKRPVGWGKDYLEIQGQRYCDDFIGSITRRTVFITGNATNYKLW